MNIRFYILLLGLVGTSLNAGEQVLNVTPQTLEGWRVYGADLNTLTEGTQLRLPAGGQLSRQFQGNAVILHLSTTPVLSADSADWPIAGVGPVALALIRKDTQGKLVLVLDEATVKPLPWTIPLGKEASGIELVLAYDPISGAGLISYQDKAQGFDTTASDQPVEVWLSAGSKSPWPLDLMQVMLLTPDPEDSVSTAAKSSSTGKQSPANRLQSAVSDLLAGGAGEATNGSGVAGVVNPTGAAGVSTLEIFTPPSVRRGKIIEVVRAKVAKNQSK